jgi:hypothetical protein
LLSLRVQWFERSSLPYKDAYDELAQQAPLERLQARLDAIPAPQRPGLSRRWFIGAAAASLLAGGVLADRLFLAWQSQQAHNWRAWWATIWRCMCRRRLIICRAMKPANARNCVVDARLGHRLHHRQCCGAGRRNSNVHKCSSTAAYRLRN